MGAGRPPCAVGAISMVLMLAPLWLCLSAADVLAAGDVNRGLGQRDLSSLAASPDGRLFVGARGLVYRSEPGAYDWRPSLLLRARGAEVELEDAFAAETFDVSVEEQIEERLEELIEELREELRVQLEEVFFDSALLEEVVEDEIEAQLDELRDLAEAEISEGFASLELEDDERPELQDDQLEEARVRHLLAPADRPGWVVASTGVGVHVTGDGGRRWRSLSLSSGSESDPSAVASATFGDRLWVVTPDALYSGALSGSRLEADLSLPATGELVFVAVCDGRLHVVEEAEVWSRSLEGEDGWRREGAGTVAGRLRHLGCAGGTRWLSAESGVLRWEGERWDRMSDAGLPSRDVRMTLVAGDGELWVATGSGVARWVGDRWRQDGGSGSGAAIRWMVETSWGSILAATDIGLLEVMDEEIEDAREALLRSLQAVWAGEPAFGEVVAAAMEHLGAEILARESWMTQEALGHALTPRQIRLEGRWWRIDDMRADRVDVRPTPTLRRTFREMDREVWEVVVRLQWDLGRPVDAARGVQHAQNDRRMVALERRVQARLLRLWRDRRAGMLALAAAADAPVQVRLRQQIRILRLSAELDALTGWRYGFSTGPMRPPDTGGE
ncbi:MAG: hypothetical protein EA398_04315 [Deltaproteobacteria bacterium]|nr:MAG: hypothetical protein EA398_04315 [Deltaproteobacteria bacterium]